MRLPTCLALLTLLIPAIPAHADLSEADGMIGISAREVGRVVRFPREGYRLLAERDRPDGRAHYYLFSHNVTGLNVSIRIEPAGTGVPTWPPPNCWTAPSGTASRFSNSP